LPSLPPVLLRRRTLYQTINKIRIYIYSQCAQEGVSRQRGLLRNPRSGDCSPPVWRRVSAPVPVEIARRAARRVNGASDSTIPGPGRGFCVGTIQGIADTPGPTASRKIRTLGRKKWLLRNEESRREKSSHPIMQRHPVNQERSCGNKEQATFHTAPSFAGDTRVLIEREGRETLNCYFRNLFS
jgi:hypothetical protein